jgi:hypothetical protein
MQHQLLEAFSGPHTCPPDGIGQGGTTQHNTTQHNTASTGREQIVAAPAATHSDGTDTHSLREAEKLLLLASLVWISQPWRLTISIRLATAGA